MLQVTRLRVADTDALAIYDDGPGLSSELHPWQVTADVQMLTPLLAAGGVISFLLVHVDVARFCVCQSLHEERREIAANEHRQVNI